MAKVYVGLGSNLGKRRRNIEAAISCLGAHPGVQVLRVSTLIETEPVGGAPQPRFLNGVAELEVELSPEELLQELLAIEKKLGRVRREKWGPRVIDLDLLFYNDCIIERPELQVPHPLAVERGFVLEPLAELAPELVHPQTGKSTREHLKLFRKGQAEKS